MKTNAVIEPSAPPRICSRPGCREPVAGTREIVVNRKSASAPSLHCEDHRAELARIRSELETDARRMSENGGAPNSKARTRRKQGPTCTRDGCFEPRRGGETLCDVCQAEGYEESE